MKFINLRGELEVIGKIGDEVYHYEKQSNIVTKWAKHVVMHLMTGEVFTTHGMQRSSESVDHFENSPGIGRNNDGTLISSAQYFNDPVVDPDFFRLTPNPMSGPGDNPSGEFKYPFFPVKMLFGTGEEYRNWDDITFKLGAEQGAIRQNELESQGWNQSVFDEADFLQDSRNDYSNTPTSTGLAKTRTVNSQDSAPKTSPSLTENAFGITGAIKNGMYFDSISDSNLIDISTGVERIVLTASGTGKPSFVYARRNLRFMQGGADIQLSSDIDVENRFTFTVDLPEQTGSYGNVFYPYNGYLLKEAGLFADSFLLLGNNVPTPSDGVVYQNYNRMPYGTMIAKRYITPVQKVAEGSVSFRWTLYL